MKESKIIVNVSLDENNIPEKLQWEATDGAQDLSESKTAAQKNITFYKEEMLKTWEELPQMFYTSSVKEMGQKEILSFIGNTNNLFQ